MAHTILVMASSSLSSFAPTLLLRPLCLPLYTSIACPTFHAAIRGGLLEEEMGLRGSRQMLSNNVLLEGFVVAEVYSAHGVHDWFNILQYHVCS